MANNYFKFKQFIVYQDNTAMKVGVDAVLLGAWANPGNASNILDIGTGTGLLSLMIAQKSNAQIIAIEIDENAYKQAVENIQISPWPNKIGVLNISLQEFALTKGQKFDFIICNPPYYSNSMVSDDKNRTLARHDHSLTPFELAKNVNHLLCPDGRFIMIYPYSRKEDMIKAFVLNKLYPLDILEIKGTDAKLRNRIIIEFSRKYTVTRISTIAIRNSETNDYSFEYKELTKDYYLKF